jgi:hypothetical protein
MSWFLSLVAWGRIAGLVRGLCGLIFADYHVDVDVKEFR